jgi:hypothetical protein
MPIAESILVLTDEEGITTRLPVYKSTMIKFERRFKRAYNTDMVTDAATMAYYLAHEQAWPPSDPVLEDWFDSVHFAAEEAEPPGTNGDRPTAPPAPE